MGSPLPPDPYIALGVAKDATAAAIKLQYRKLVLKFHPDKVQDESQKQVAADQFHRIQTAWEIVGDEEKRKRYDAQCELAQLRKEMLADRQSSAPSRGTPDVRTAAFKVPPDTPRGGAYHARGPERTTSPTYEERKPNYASAYGGGSGDYFGDYTPRASATRKDPEQERSSRRMPPREDKDRTKAAREAKEAKEKEKSRQSRERSRRSDKDIRRDRDRKTASVVDEDTESDPDAPAQPRRRSKEDLEELKRAQDLYHEQARKQKEAAERGYFDSDERARKMYSQYDGAREYVEKSRGSRPRMESERRPSPARVASSRDKVEYIKRSGAPPVMVRRGSGRPTTAGRDPEERRSSLQAERKWSGDEEEESPRRPPPLSQSKSSPAEIKIPITDKQRSHSLQVDSPTLEKEKEDMPPKVKRADTMPHVHTARERDIPRRKDGIPNMPTKGSHLRQTELVDGLPTPAATPEYSGNVNANANKYRYQQEYADDHEYATPDGYRTELRQPPAGGATTTKPRYTKSPDRMGGERERDRPHRAASARYEEHLSPHRPVQPSRTTSTSYVYTPGQGVNETAYGRPAMNRETSSASARGPLYGEVPATVSGRESRDRERETRSPRQPSSRYSPPPESVRYAKDVRPEDIRMQSGYSGRRTSDARPSYSRGGSYVYAK